MDAEVATMALIYAEIHLDRAREALEVAEKQAAASRANFRLRKLAFLEKKLGDVTIETLAKQGITINLTP